MNGLLLVIQTISDFLWGTPMTIALIGTGLYLSIKFKFRYITKIKFHFQNTFGKMFKGKGEGEGTVSGFAAACTAMANTIGVGKEHRWCGNCDHDGRTRSDLLDVDLSTSRNVYKSL